MTTESVRGCLSFVMRALDPCTPLGVIECATWALSERACDGACLCLAVACVAGTMGRGARAWLCGMVWSSPKAAPGVHPEMFWEHAPHPHTYYVRRAGPGRMRPPPRPGGD